MHGRTITINGKRWIFKWWPFGRGETDGECDPPSKTHKEIRIRNSLNRPVRQRRLMEVAIHEAIHAAAWPLDHEVVESGAEDIAEFLWRLGYRRSEP
jgi:hypothetical protein